MTSTLSSSDLVSSQVKYTAIADLIARRIRKGDYALGQLPSERKLASELGVSYMTARRAVSQLIDDGHLERGNTGRLQIPENKQRKQNLNIAMVLHDLQSASQIDWRNALDRVVDEAGGTLRTVTYAHKDDPRLLEVLGGEFDGIFLLPPPNPSPLLLGKLQQVRHKVVTIWHDFTEYGIACVNGEHSGGINKLIHYLAGQGYTRIDCLNTIGRTDVIENRITTWREALEETGLTGSLYSDEISSFLWGDKKAYQFTSQLLEREQLQTQALFCTTTRIAVGANRAAYEHDIKVGRDLALCGFAELNQAQMMTPSLTVVDTPDPAPYLKIGLQWILDKGQNWNRPLKITPAYDDMKLFIGESTSGSAPCQGKAYQTNHQLEEVLV